MNKAVTVGFFDGVHVGHRRLIDTLSSMAYARNLAPYIITFEQHPLKHLFPDTPLRLIDLNDERQDLLTSFCEQCLPVAPQILVLPFEKIMNLSAQQFMQYVHDKLDASFLLMGYDHHFGADVLTSFEEYRTLGERLGMTIYQAEVFCQDGIAVSSSKIRQRLTIGDIEVANRMLGRPFQLIGTVIHGKGLGSSLHFPTANMEIDSDKILPQEGVYRAEVSIDDDPRFYPALLNIGTNPTIATINPVTVEVHIPNFKGDLYGRTLRAKLKKFIRPEIKFPTVEHLKSQIRADLRLLMSDGD